jgi:hypothetical protein
MPNAMPAQRILGLAMIAVGMLGLASHKPAAAQVATAAPADFPKVQNANVQTRALSGSLESALSSLAAESASGPLWAGYLVEEVAGQKFTCCGTSSDEAYRCGTCRLERDSASGSSSRSGSLPEEVDKVVHLEDSGHQIAVLFRLEGKAAQRIRVASETCTLDAGGLRLVWLTGIRGDDSVTVLKRYVNGGFDDSESRHLGNDALTAIALHADPSADRVMQEFTAPSAPEKLRKQAAFWLGAARGTKGVSLLEQMAKSDPSSEVRSQVAFGLFVSKQPAAVDDMIHMAREDSSTHVRGQALFWLAQKAGQKAVNAISGTLENDPDTEVKKKAVFALSQLPGGEGVPKLIEVAQNNPNREVRKQAMFWLGQSHDPRALDFFEKILRQ